MIWRKAERARSLLAADIRVIGAPMYNFSVPANSRVDRSRLRGGEDVSATTKRACTAGCGKKLIIAPRVAALRGDTPMAAADHQGLILRSVVPVLGITTSHSSGPRAWRGGDTSQQGARRRAIGYREFGVIGERFDRRTRWLAVLKGYKEIIRLYAEVSEGSSRTRTVSPPEIPGVPWDDRLAEREHCRGVSTHRVRGMGV